MLSFKCQSHSLKMTNFSINPRKTFNFSSNKKEGAGSEWVRFEPIELTPSGPFKNKIKPKTQPKTWSGRTPKQTPDQDKISGSRLRLASTP